jgi:antitoxin FitA
MGQLLIRNLDDEVLADYRAAAKRRGRSLEAEVRDLLTRMRPKSPARIAELQQRLAAIRAMTPPVPQTPSEVLVREDRDGRRDA